MNPYQYHEKILHPDEPEALAPVILLVESLGLHFEADVELTVALYEGASLVGTGSLAGNVLKCLAVRSAEQGQGIAAALVSRLITEAYDRGRTHLFIFTPAHNRPMFRELGFYELITTNPGITLLENRRNGFAEYLKQLQKDSPETLAALESGSESDEELAIGTIVMNANPFTLGHQYLVEQAAAICSVLHVFVLSEERSSFPADVRYRLVKEGTSHLNNVLVHRGGPYLISAATFPSYFLKDPASVNDIHCRLDLTLFGSRIAPALGINHRFIGQEPYCATTRQYNETMKILLPEMGIEVVEIPRLTNTDGWISASKVRSALMDDRLDLLQQMVPETTLIFLLSDEGRQIMNFLHKGNRH